MVDTYFIDLDGTIFEYEENFLNTCDSKFDLKAKEGAAEYLANLHCMGAKIILVTARPGSMFEITTRQLEKNKIMYDDLLMGIGSGTRYLINDKRSAEDSDKAVAINVLRYDKKFGN